MVRLSPGLVFLDVRMPGLSGAEVARALQLGPTPHVVSVTAHAHHAVEAFDVEAADYLLTPFDAQRLARALERVRRRREEPAEPLRRLDRLVVSAAVRNRA
ncbi:MAG TPA: response regulator [Thermoanaerobaculia bacterium]|nr:response regulator [Thermoanaerobaculia bacterium]